MRNRAKNEPAVLAQVEPDENSPRDDTQVKDLENEAEAMEELAQELEQELAGEKE